MSLMRCPNGHMFNTRKHGSICPYCNMETAVVEEAKAPEGFETPMELLEEEVPPVCGWLVCIEGARIGRDYKSRTVRILWAEGMTWISSFWEITRFPGKTTRSSCMTPRRKYGDTAR